MSSFHVYTAADDAASDVDVRRIDIADVLDALRLGFEDFREKPSHLVFLGLIYPIAGIAVFVWASGANALQLLYPLTTGFALLGPFAAIGLYEISRRRERKLDTSWVHAFEVLKSPAIPAICVVAGLLIVLFLAWLLVAELLYVWLFGPTPPSAIVDFATDVVTTPSGWALFILGNAIGFLFALTALITTVIAFPLLLDRDVGAVIAVRTSAKAFQASPVPILAWGFIVALGLVIGALPFLVGLAIVLPVLGHATWHLYRKVIVAPDEKSRAAASS